MMSTRKTLYLGIAAAFSLSPTLAAAQAGPLPFPYSAAGTVHCEGVDREGLKIKLAPAQVVLVPAEPHMKGEFRDNLGNLLRTAWYDVSLYGGDKDGLVAFGQTVPTVFNVVPERVSSDDQDETGLMKYHPAKHSQIKLEGRSFMFIDQAEAGIAAECEWKLTASPVD